MSKSVEKIICEMAARGERFCNSKEFVQIAQTTSATDCKKLLKLLNGESKVHASTYVALMQLIGDIYVSGVKGVDNGIFGDALEAFFHADTCKGKRAQYKISDKIGVDFMRNGYRIEVKHNSGELNNIRHSDVILYAYALFPHAGITSAEIYKAFDLYRVDDFEKVVYTVKKCGKKTSSYVGYTTPTNGGETKYRIRSNLGSEKLQAMHEDFAEIRLDKSIIYPHYLSN